MQILRKKVKKLKRKIISAVIICLFYIFLNWQNNMLTVSEYVYKSGKISESMRIVQISDLHNKNINERLIEKIKSLAPDVIVITGDIADASHTDIQRAVEFAELAADIADVYYITGNHEYWLEKSQLDELMNGLENAKVNILDNECREIRENFVLVGLDDRNLSDLTLKNMNLDKDNLNVLLAHEPQNIENYAEETNVDLVLSGHAHGGQFRLPFVGGIVAPDQGFFPEYTGGEYFFNDTEMIVSRGIGNSVIPFRLFNFPDIVCIDFENG